MILRRSRSKAEDSLHVLHRDCIFLDHPSAGGAHSPSLAAALHHRLENGRLEVRKRSVRRAALRFEPTVQEQDHTHTPSMQFLTPQQDGKEGTSPSHPCALLPPSANSASTEPVEGQTDAWRTPLDLPYSLPPVSRIPSSKPPESTTTQLLLSPCKLWCCRPPLDSIQPSRAFPIVYPPSWLRLVRPTGNYWKIGGALTWNYCCFAVVL